MPKLFFATEVEIEAFSMNPPRMTADIHGTIEGEHEETIVSVSTANGDTIDVVKDVLAHVRESFGTGRKMAFTVNDEGNRIIVPGPGAKSVLVEAGKPAKASKKKS